jgi:hypothetical protein
MVSHVAFVGTFLANDFLRFESRKPQTHHLPTGRLENDQRLFRFFACGRVPIEAVTGMCRQAGGGLRLRDATIPQVLDQDRDTQRAVFFSRA